MKKLILFIILIYLTGCTALAPNDNPNNNNPPSTEEPSEPEEPIEPSEPQEPIDTSIFHEYKNQAMNTLEDMTLEEKIGQLFLVRCPRAEQLDFFLSMKPGGFIMFGIDFAEKTKEQVIGDIKYYQDNSDIPMIIGVDEEGGTVVRVSSNSLLSKERFKSPQELYTIGGLDEIKRDSREKSKLLLSLGVNLNLAPVADVSVNESDFIFQRAFGKPAAETAEYVKTVVEAMRDAGISSTLKHFPGYGNNIDTHTGSSYDTRPYEQFVYNDFIPFKAGIESGTESILVSHNVVEDIDSEYPASLSKKTIDILRNDFNFTGIVMTDDLSMAAISELQTDLPAEILAVLAGNDMLIVTDFEYSYKTLLNAAKAGNISIERIDESVLRILEWKYYMHIMN
ncbi:MAG: beta-hexosaminidase [Sedimentibacter sp.]|jgi:beta-N-acetylhexosaminidase|nr:beta-hexosaminidase [Sedimentibacter sp.]